MAHLPDPGHMHWLHLQEERAAAAMEFWAAKNAEEFERFKRDMERLNQREMDDLLRSIDAEIKETQRLMAEATRRLSQNERLPRALENAIKRYKKEYPFSVCRVETCSCGASDFITPEERERSKRFPPFLPPPFPLAPPLPEGLSLPKSDQVPPDWLFMRPMENSMCMHDRPPTDEELERSHLLFILKLIVRKEPECFEF